MTTALLFRKLPVLHGVVATWRRLRAELPERLLSLVGVKTVHWVGAVMDQETRRVVAGMQPSARDVLEISGTAWRDFGFRSYESVDYPAYDVCAAPYVDRRYDLVIAEQVFEHLLWPRKAAVHVREMLRPGGVFLVTTPFLIRVHPTPADCSRWTETGLKYLLADAGFDPNLIETGAWGNRPCLKANFSRWPRWIPWWHDLKNEPEFPLVVWAFARVAAD